MRKEGYVNETIYGPIIFTFRQEISSFGSSQMKTWFYSKILHYWHAIKHIMCNNYYYKINSTFFLIGFHFKMHSTFSKKNVCAYWRENKARLCATTYTFTGMSRRYFFLLKILKVLWRAVLLEGFMVFQET